MPKITAKTFTTTYRGKLTDIATIARWYVSQGVLPRSRSELLNTAVVNFVQQLRLTTKCAVTNDADALDVLGDLGLLGTKPLGNTPELETWADTPSIPGQSAPNEADLRNRAERDQIDVLAELLTRTVTSPDEQPSIDRSTLPLANDEEED